MKYQYVPLLYTNSHLNCKVWKLTFTLAHSRKRLDAWSLRSAATPPPLYPRLYDALDTELLPRGALRLERRRAFPSEESTDRQMV